MAAPKTAATATAATTRTWRRPGTCAWSEWSRSSSWRLSGPHIWTVEGLDRVKEPKLRKQLLAILQERLAEELREAGFVLERRAFSPHITIARRIERALALAAMTPVPWSVTAFALVQSDLATGTYRDLARWALAAPNEGKRAS